MTISEERLWDDQRVPRRTADIVKLKGKSGA